MPDRARLSPDMAWQRLGAATPEADGTLELPAAPDAPGLYRFHIGDSETVRVYVGERGDLARRFAGFENPGPSPVTNRRIHARLAAALAAGHTRFNR